MDASDCTSIKRCSCKSNCLHPEHKDGWLPATLVYFHRKRDSSDGLNNKCKVCNQAAGRAWAIAHSERAKAYQDAYKEANKERLREQKRQYHADNRSRHLTEFAEYARCNCERLRTQRRKRYVENAPRIKVANHQRRAQRKQAPGRYTIQDVRLLLLSQKGLCWWCGVPVGDTYHVDHRIPLSRGGSNYPENLCISCPNCNLSKHNKLPSEWNGRLL